MTAGAELTYRDGPSGPRERTAVDRLLLDIFDLDVSPIDKFGLRDPTYHSFSYMDELGRCVANAATFTLALIIGGKPANAMGIQSVATRPEWRRHGLSHDLLERALRWCDRSAGLAFLMTSIPRFYEPMGFRIVPQFAYFGDAPAASPLTLGCRRLNLDAGEDCRLLAKVLRRRVPVSARFAVDGLPGAFMLNLFGEVRLSAWYIESREAVVVTAERSDGTLCIVDIATAAMPPLEAVVTAFENHPKQVEVRFPPDRLAWNGTATPARTSTVLMVRGDPGPLEPFMIPETASF